MNIANKLLTQNEMAVLGADGVGTLLADAGAPNGISFGATVTLVPNGNERYARLDFPIGDYSAWPRMAVVWHATADDGSHVKAARLFQPASGVVTIAGGEDAVFGRCAGLSITEYELCPIDSSGRMGFSDGRHLCETGTPPDEGVRLGAAPAFTSALVAGEAFSKNDGSVVNATAATTVTITYEQADDSGGTGAASVAVTDLTAPAGAADKYLRIRREVDDPSLAESLVDHSPWTFCAAEAEDVALGVAPAMTGTPTEGYAPTYSAGTVINETGSTTIDFTFWEVETATGGTPTQVTLASGKFPTTGMKAYVFARREVDDPSLGSPLVDFSARVAVRHLPSFTSSPSLSALTEAAAFTRTPAETAYTTENTTIVASYRQADDGSGTNPTGLTVAGSTMPASVNAYVETTDTMTDPLLTGAGIASRTASSAWTACANATDTVPPKPTPTFGETITAYNGTDKYFRPTVTSFASHTAGDQYEWTTSLLSPIPDSQTELMAAVTGGWRTQMDDPAARVDPNTQTTAGRTDYACFRFTGGSPWVLAEVKGERLRFRRRRLVSPGVYGPWSEWTEQYSCPKPSAVTPTTGWQKRWMPVVIRSKEAAAIPVLDGEGLQFLRSFATTPANPGLILAVMDQNFQWETDDGGETFYTPPWNGQWAGRQGISSWIDPQDSKRQIVAYAAAPASQSAAFLSLDGGVTCTKVLDLPQARGTNALRHNYQSICHKPGGTPATRTVFLLAGLATASSNSVATIQLYRSTNGGASFSTRGSALSVATFASGNYYPYEIAFNPSGSLMQMCGPNGLWWSDDDGLTWTKATGLPAGAIHHIQYKSSGETWVGTNGGLYVAANGKAFTRNTGFGTTACRYFAISPEDSNYIVAAKVGSMHPFWSTTGGSSWTQGVNHPRPGQAYSTAHTLANADHGGIVGLYGDRNRFFFHLAQHYGVSTDHGQNIYHAGYLFSGSHSRGDIGFNPDPAKWGNWAMGGQDYGSIITQNAGVHFAPDEISGTSGGYAGEINTQLDYTDNISGAGALMHSSGRIVFSGGIVLGRRVHVIEDQSYASGGSISGTTVSNFISDLSDNAAMDPHSANQGFIGKYRVSNLNAGTRAGVTFTAMAHHFVTLTGFGGSTVLYGCDTSGSVIYRSASATPGASWTAWRTTQRSFRPVDTRPWFVACQNHAARVYAVSGAGYITRIVGASSPTETTIFDARNYVSGYPAYQCRSFSVDPRNPDLGYVSLYMWGCPNVYRCTNLTTTTGAAGDWESIATDDHDGLPHIDMELNVHPHTSELFATGPHGTYCCKPPAGHNATYGITHSVWDTLDAFFATVQ